MRKPVEVRCRALGGRGAPRYQPGFGTWHLVRFRHPVTAVDPFGRSGVADIQQELARGFDMIDLKTIAAEATIAGALGLTALGMGLGVANAAPPSPVTSGTPWPQDKPHGDGHGHGDWHGGQAGGLGRGALARRARVPGGSTRASPPPVRSATSPATCASSRGSCRRYSGGARASTCACAVEARLGAAERSRNCLARFRGSVRRPPACAPQWRCL